MSYFTDIRLGCRGKYLAVRTENEITFTTPKGKAAINIETAEKMLDAGFRDAKILNSVSAGVLPDDAALLLAVKSKYSLRFQGALANGIACAADGKNTLKKIIPSAGFIDNGTDLESTVRVLRAGGSNIFILANNGALICGDSEADLNEKLTAFFDALEKFYKSHKLATSLELPQKNELFIFETAPVLRSAMAKCGNAASIASSAYFELPSGVIAPVYHHCAGILKLDSSTSVETIVDKLETQTYVAVNDKAVFARGCNFGKAKDKMALALEAALAVKLASAAGGATYLDNSPDKSSLCTVKRSKATGIEGKIALITGGAQGFGFGIAEYLAATGATVVIADMNLAGAERAAESINQQNGNCHAFALEVNIADEASVEAMTRKLVCTCGGVDLFIANAGVVRAGSVKEMEKRDWDFVTNINYTGYFLCVKHISRVMTLQNRYGSQWTDIVQINSKSGLVGSNRNGAYAGSKFGTIGLTQSFALELIESKIKVNSICPGNYFEGPLWSDAKNGLFVQYLNSGKVPGAKNVEEVKAFYESKIPMGRGCLPSDVAKAIIYCVEQQYETGQAIPVAGAQVMLN